MHGVSQKLTTHLDKLKGVEGESLRLGRTLQAKVVGVDQGKGVPLLFLRLAKGFLRAQWLPKDQPLPQRGDSLLLQLKSISGKRVEFELLPQKDFVSQDKGSASSQALQRLHRLLPQLWRTPESSLEGKDSGSQPLLERFLGNMLTLRNHPSGVFMNGGVMSLMESFRWERLQSWLQYRSVLERWQRQKKIKQRGVTIPHLWFDLSQTPQDFFARHESFAFDAQSSGFFRQQRHPLPFFVSDKAPQKGVAPIPEAIAWMWPPNKEGGNREDPWLFWWPSYGERDLEIMLNSGLTIPTFWFQSHEDYKNYSHELEEWLASHPIWRNTYHIIDGEHLWQAGISFLSDHSFADYTV